MTMVQNHTIMVWKELLQCFGYHFYLLQFPRSMLYVNKKFGSNFWEVRCTCIHVAITKHNSRKLCGTAFILQLLCVQIVILVTMLATDVYILLIMSAHLALAIKFLLQYRPGDMRL